MGVRLPSTARITADPRGHAGRLKSAAKSAQPNQVLEKEPVRRAVRNLREERVRFWILDAYILQKKMKVECCDVDRQRGYRACSFTLEYDG
jgi:hypothetical protein